MDLELCLWTQYSTCARIYEFRPLMNPGKFALSNKGLLAQIKMRNRLILSASAMKSIPSMSAPNCSFIIRQSHDHTMKTLYRPSSFNQEKFKESKTDKLSHSLRLMTDIGFIQSSGSPGIYHLLPLGTRVLEKLIRIVDHFMKDLGSQKVIMPTLSSANLWKTTGRYEECSTELFKINDRHLREYVLSPTHEEVVCDILRSTPLTHRNLPLRLYQITSKFRDELKPRFGLLRGREFLMKDLYTFDTDETNALKTYEEVNKVYSDLFDYLGLKWVKVRGSSGTIGGNLSHEFHLVSKIGEDQIFVCSECHEGFNQELLEANEELRIEAGGGSSTKTLNSCPNCSSTNILTSSAIEVGHSFFLGTKYTKALNVTYKPVEGHSEYVQMGCFGLGISRILASVVEVLSTETEIRWPLPIAPYLIGIIPPKEGSKEERFAGDFVQDLTRYFQKILPNDVILDDRTQLTIGKRFKDLNVMGVPYAIVLGKGLHLSPKVVELHDLNSGTSIELGKDQIFNYCYDLKSQWKLI